MVNKNPLVSIIIPNRNHSDYLGQAIESALGQTYKNIEIILCDNCSTDNSLDVAMKYLDRGVNICKNPINIFNHNYEVLASLIRGKYFMVLCADDLIKPNFLEITVAIMEEHENVGYVHCERDYVDERGHITELDPFFNCSFIATGESMMPIYMLTEVGQAAQALIRRTTFEDAGRHDTETNHANIDRELWFRLSMFSDYAYILKKLSLIRVHSQSETSRVAENFVHPLSIFVMIKGFIEWAKLKNYEKVLERESQALNKLALEVVNTAIFVLKRGDISLGKQHILLAQIISKNIVENSKFKLCQEAIETDNINIFHYSDSTDIRLNNHKRSYNPPNGYINELSLKDGVGL